MGRYKRIDDNGCITKLARDIHPRRFFKFTPFTNHTRPHPQQ